MKQQHAVQLILWTVLALLPESARTVSLHVYHGRPTCLRSWFRRTGVTPKVKTEFCRYWCPNSISSPSPYNQRRFQQKSLRKICHGRVPFQPPVQWPSMTSGAKRAPALNENSSPIVALKNIVHHAQDLTIF